MDKSMNSQAGFTLIEVMVALMILAVVAVSASQASSGYLRTVDGMKTRTLAHFVAQNMAANLQINQGWLTAEKSETINQQGRRWQVVYTPQAVTNDDGSDNIQTVNINVAEVIEGSDKTGAGSDITVMIRNANK